MSASRTVGLGVALIFIPWLAPVAQADPLFTVTDLGDGYTLQQDSTGYTHGLTNADGSVTYAFDKSPVQVTITYDPGFVTSPNDEPGMLKTFKVGNFETSDFWYQKNNLVYWGSWITYQGWNINDVNTHGAVVGEVDGTARVNDAGLGLPLNPYSTNNNDLNDYIPAVPGLQAGDGLRTALTIDDDGRILVEGTNNQYYLLTPVALGDPATVPEPSTLLIFGVSALAFGSRPIRRILGLGCAGGDRPDR